MFTCASCTIEACRSGQLDKMPKNCPMRDRAFFDSILEEYFKPENHDFFIASAATEAIGYCLMGTLILIEVVRTVAFWLMDEKGL